MKGELSAEVEALWRQVEEAIDTGRAEERVLPLAAQLARLAPDGSDAWLYAVRYLAEAAVHTDPWRGALIARRIVQARPDDDGGWAVLALAQSLLGNHRFAVRAYRKALRIAPDNPWYAHNLGHLYDVALGRPGDAIELLGRAYSQLRARQSMNEVAASYAHALLRVGDAPSARRVMRDVVRGRASREHHELYSEILRVEQEQVDSFDAPQQRRRVRRRHVVTPDE